MRSVRVKSADTVPTVDDEVHLPMTKARTTRGRSRAVRARRPLRVGYTLVRGVFALLASGLFPEISSEIPKQALVNVEVGI